MASRVQDLERSEAEINERVGSLESALRAIGDSVSSALNDPDSDPVVLLRVAREEVAANQVKVEEANEQTRGLREKLDALERELEDARRARIEAERAASRVPALAKGMQEIATAVGASQGGFFGLFQAKKAEEDLVEDILSKVKTLMERT